MKNMSPQQKRKASALIREKCANYMYGQCLPLDTSCPQCHSFSLICKWFPEAVLPLDTALHAEVIGIDGVKKCVVCRSPFHAASNRAKYCPDCAVKQRRKQKAACERRRRAG